ncbi:MAG: Tn3 family transposase [Candidatus Lariskella arthropodorum]
MNAEQDHLFYVLPYEKQLLQKKRGASSVAYLLLLKWFEKTASFPDSIDELPEDFIKHAIVYFADSIVQEDLCKLFEQKRTINRYKQEIRRHFNFEVFNEHCPLLREFLMLNIFKDKNEEILLCKLCNYLKKNKMEIPAETKLLELLKDARSEKEKQIFAKINTLLSEEDKNYIDEYLSSSQEHESIYQFLRQDSGSSTKKNVKQEISKLNILKRLPMASLAFLGDINIKQRTIYRRRFLTDTPSRFKRRSRFARYSIAVIFCYQRYQEVLDNLVEHLLYFVHQVKKIADNKQTHLNKEIGKRLDDLELLYQLAVINHDHPKGIIEQEVYPYVPQEVIKQIIETRDFARQLKKIVQNSVIKRYSMSYRSTIFSILDCLELDSNNLKFLDIIKLIKEYQKSTQKYYLVDIDIPIDGFVSKQQQKYIFEKDVDGNSRILRKSYECAIFKLLRVKLRHKEVWVKGSYKYRDPIDDLPEEFEKKREEYFGLLGAPLSVNDFVAPLKNDMKYHLETFDNELPQNKLVRITHRKNKPWIQLTPLTKVEEPKVIQRIKDAILAKWGVIDLLDILKEVDLRENFTECFNTAGNREILDRETIRKRLLLCNFTIGTNAGLKRNAGASKGTVTFEELRHIKNFFFSKDDLREAINLVINAIFRIRNPKIWRSQSTACAADSKQFGCFRKNLLTEWSPRHHTDGVMIYWHVSDQYICVYSQLKSCTSSEVASMLQGIMDQETNMDIESQYVDSHGKSELGFALSYLEKFDLLPRYKSIGEQKLYLPEDNFYIHNISEITARSINWQFIIEQYDEMVKYAVALKIGTAPAETIIRRFARSNYQHPTFQAFIELGKAVKTIFLCRYLKSVELRQQINAGLNVVENWNSANDFVYYGKGGEITSNNRDDQEISMLCLHLLQTCIVYINTLLIEELLEDEYWKNQLTQEDYRALSALFYLHINPYGSFELDLTKRLFISQISEDAKI